MSDILFEVFFLKKFKLKTYANKQL